MPSEAATDTRPLADRLRPRSLGELVGNPRAVAELRQWAAGWTRSRGVPHHPAVLFEGPPGVGKTTAALALAAEEGWTVVEMNASDARNQSALEEVAGRAALTNTLGSFGVYRGTRGGGRTLILLDEADSLSGRLASSERTRPRAAVSLREFLRGRYGSVDALAEAWGLGAPGGPAPFASWEAVPVAAGRAGWTRLAPAQRDLKDWKEGEGKRDLSDRGGLATIVRLVKETRQPLVLTVNDPQPLTRYSPVFRSQVARIRFTPIPPHELKTYLRRVAVREGFALPGTALDRIVARSQGDVRAALNDLEAIAPLPPGTDLTPLLGGRDIAEDFYGLVDEVLSEPRFYRSVEISNRLDATPDDLLPWIEESIVRASVPAPARAAAFARLAVADRFLFRARRQRVYSLWSYATETLTGGVSLDLHRTGPPARGPAVAFPQFLGAMGRSKGMRAMRLALLAKAGRHLHLSRRKASEVALPFLVHVFEPVGRRRAGPAEADALRRALVRDLELTSEELATLTGLEPDHPRIQELLKPASPVAPPARATPAPTRPAAEPEPPAAPEPVEATGPKRKVQKQLGEY